MNRFHSYMNTAAELLKEYAPEPCSVIKQSFAGFSKEFFSRTKKYGSRDRKLITHLCYCFFRMGKEGLGGKESSERILAGLFLSSDEPNEILEFLKPGWNKLADRPFSDKASELGKEFSLDQVFPWKNELCPGVEAEAFITSHFKQPDLYLRLRPGFENTVKEKLQGAEIKFTEIGNSCLALPNSTKLDGVIEMDREAVIQDYNSQRVGEFLPVRPGQSDRVWDCCAGSGGKSLMLYDLNPSIQLTVSDVRESILINLKKRFRTAGIQNYTAFVADLTKPPSSSEVAGTKPDLVICDAPCTGSGTWSRTPEQLYCFNPDKISQYQDLQKKILKNLIQSLKPGGYLLYCTCSVFSKENEEITDWLNSDFKLETVKTELLKGYDKKADTLFAALLRK